MSDSVRAFVLALALGLALLAIAAIHDRRARLRAERVEIVPADEPDADSRDTVGRHSIRLAADPFTRAERDSVEEWQRQDATERIDAHLADATLATHLDPATCIVHDAAVLVCDDPISDVREVLDVCRQALAAGRALLLVAPQCAVEVVEMLAVNLHAGSLASCVAVGGDAGRAHVCEVTGAAGVPASDLRSGHLPTAVFGRAQRVVCDETGLWIGEGDPDVS